MKHCTKCNGFGYLNGFSHVRGGICFQCGGKKTITDEEIKQHNAKNNDKHKRSAKKREVILEYPAKIEKAKKDIDMYLSSDEPFETEEEREIFNNYVAKKRKQIEEMEKELEEAMKTIVKQK